MTLPGHAQRMVRNLLRRQAIFRARSYQAVFGKAAPGHARGSGLSRDQEIVLADLREFCRGNSTTFNSDPYAAARLAGRREAWLRITQHLNLDEERVQKLVELEDGLED